MSKKKKTPRYYDNLYCANLNNGHDIGFIIDVSNGAVKCPSKGISALAKNLTVDEFICLRNTFSDLIICMDNYYFDFASGGNEHEHA